VVGAGLSLLLLLNGSLLASEDLGAKATPQLG
jgi:hypothetical protein